jgi:5-methylcytosine-specific restriction endonuclease McrA
MKGKLYDKQKGICPVCNSRIDLHTIMYSFKPVIHHIVPITEGGERGKISNLVLLHKGCHLETHGMKNRAD